MATITKSLTIESQGTYNLTFDLWSYSEWAASAGITTSYASLAALIADEKAVRQLMTVHASVDYFANCPDSTIISTVINNDLCAKWINLRDYALDTLSAKSNIKSVMDTADKYGYGEWGLKDVIPRLTSDTSASPSITLSSSGTHSSYPMWKAFDGDETISGTPSGWLDITAGAAYLEVDFVNPVKVSRFYVFIKSHPENGATVHPTAVQAYVNGEWQTIETINYATTGSRVYVDADVTTSKIRLYDSNTSTSHPMVISFQAYTWGALGCVPIMTANNAPYGVASAYQVFDGNASTSANGTDFSYQSVNPICVKRYKALGAGGATITGTIQGSNDGSTWTNITLASNTTYYMYHRLHLASSTAVYTLQFYGRELKPLVPTMTSNTTPKGEASTNSTYYNPAYTAFCDTETFAFDGSNRYLRYQSTEKVILKYAATKDRVNSGYSFSAVYKIQGSNDGITWEDIKTNISHTFPTVRNWWGIDCGDNNDQYLYHQIVFVSYTGNVGQQMTHRVQFYGFDYSEKEFATGSTRKTIYDHGVAPSGAITGGTKNPDCLTLSAVGTATVTMNKGTRKYMGGKAGLHASGTNRLKCGSGYSNFTASNMPDSNGFDISSISGSVAVGIEQTASGTFDCTEIWLE